MRRPRRAGATTARTPSCSIAATTARRWSEPCPPEPRMTRDAAIAIDIGGTFTDVTLFDRASGRLWNAKTPSTPHDPSIGFMDGMQAALTASGLDATAVGQVIHGTT